MDFVVVGFGLGAIGVLLGVVMLGWLAPRAQRAAARAAEPDDAAYALAVAAEHQGTGQAFLFAGAAMLLATIGGLAGSLDDRTGALLVTTTATVAAIGIFLSGYLQRLRNPAPRRRSAPVAETSAGAADPAAAESTTVPEVVDPSMAEAWVFSPEDDRDVRADSFPPPDTVLEAKSDETFIPRANGGPVLGDVEPDHVGALPVAAFPRPENGLTEDVPHARPGSASAPLLDDEAVVVGYIVPATRPPNSPTPPARPDDGEDPS